MAWRSQTPWAKGGKGKQWPGQKGGRRRGAYSVCSKCGHWEYDHFGNWTCSVCGGSYLGDAAHVPHVADAGVPDQFAADLQALAAKYPTMAAALGQLQGAAPPPAPEAREPASANDIEKQIQAHRTELSRAVEKASRKERVAQSDVQQRDEAVVRHREALAKAERLHAESQQWHAEAAEALREANAQKDGFNEVQYREQLRAKGREEAAAAARAAQAAHDEAARQAAVGNVDFQWVQDHLHELSEPDLQRFHGRSHLSPEQWVEMRKVALQQRAAELEIDMASEAASEAGDPDLPGDETSELRDLRERAADTGLDPRAAERYGVLLSKVAVARAAKRAKKAVREQSNHRFVAFCQAAASQLQ
ncbi:unnamed protein product, partial [Prorocentrum cordatum]